MGAPGCIVRDAAGCIDGRAEALARMPPRRGERTARPRWSAIISPMVERRPLQSWQARIDHDCRTADFVLYTSLGAFWEAHRGRIPAQTCIAISRHMRSGMSFQEALRTVRPERNGWGPRPSL